MEILIHYFASTKVYIDKWMDKEICKLYEPTGETMKRGMKAISEEKQNKYIR